MNEMFLKKFKAKKQDTKISDKQFTERGKGFSQYKNLYFN